MAKESDFSFFEINFMCQLDWFTGCPDSWSDIILDVFVRLFLNEINIWIGRPSEADCY